MAAAREAPPEVVNKGLPFSCPQPQAAYPDNAGSVMVIEALPVYCSKYTADVDRALK
ncbi:hypothetical protein AB8A21_40155 [Streptomyces sp. BF23-18]|uniref:hypothetical protein n=1 Tax=Streptomyces sp. BF23-18 TaxID=3240282 RepID=UPI0034E3EC97